MYELVCMLLVTRQHELRIVHSVMMHSELIQQGIVIQHSEINPSSVMKPDSSILHDELRASIRISMVHGM